MEYLFIPDLIMSFGHISIKVDIFKYNNNTDQFELHYTYDCGGIPGIYDFGISEDQSMMVIALDSETQVVTGMIEKDPVVVQRLSSMYRVGLSGDGKYLVEGKQNGELDVYVNCDY